jgi:hypothetical protein
MTLHQLQDWKRWHTAHGHGRPLEMTLCDTVIAAWLGGWMLLPVLMALGAWPLLPASLALVVLPEAYHLLRRRLHQQGVLRCDWLAAVRPAR